MTPAQREAVVSKVQAVLDDPIAECFDTAVVARRIVLELLGHPALDTPETDHFEGNHWVKSLGSSLPKREGA